jgi:XTP/dITP diphosphohydrolase
MLAVNESTSGQPPAEESALLQAVEVMDRLRSPGGCPWDAAQTHDSLAKYLLEETYETLDAIADGDAVALREELGDLLLQVLFHARLAAEADGSERFTIDDVAADLVAKLVRRHPHVFGETSVSGAEEVNANWESIKQAEKQRSSVVDGVPLGQPALALAAKLIGRAARSGIEVPPAELGGPVESGPVGSVPDELSTAEFGRRLFALAGQAVAAGVDPELALRATARRFAAAVKSQEAAPSSARNQAEQAIE